MATHAMPDVTTHFITRSRTASETHEKLEYKIHGNTYSPTCVAQIQSRSAPRPSLVHGYAPFFGFMKRWRLKCPQREPPLRILIADDHAVVRSGLRTILGTRFDWQICAEAENGSQAVALAKRVHPDVAVVDLNMPGLNGLEVAAQLTENLPGIGVVLLTFHYSTSLVNAAWQSGALGFVMKSDADRDLLAAVSAVWRGQRFVTPQAQAEFPKQGSSIRGNFNASERATMPNVEVRAQVRLLAERIKRML